MRYYTALTIAGSDSCGGAGIQADIKTMSALGVYAASAITAITVQNTTGVFDIQKIEPHIVSGQIKAVMDDIHPDAIKIGMVNDAETIHAIAETLKEYAPSTHSPSKDSNHQHPFYLTIDPVMVSTSGCRLMQADALDFFIKELLPLATLLTPNIPEAEILAGMKIQNVDDIRLAATRIIQLGCDNVLIKGGHFDGEEKTDFLFEKNDFEKNDFKNTADCLCEEREGTTYLETKYKGETVHTRNTHGTGCTLSSAITSFLARGSKMENAIASAKKYLSDAIYAGKNVEIGKGHGPVNHFHAPLKLLMTKE